jgi:hypothetical protein
MNWIIPTNYSNREYKNDKCRFCGFEILYTPNVKSINDQIKAINLDHSPHICWESLEADVVK